MAIRRALFQVIILSSALMCVLYQKHQVQGKSLDKYILDAAPRADMFNFFHVMPEGEVMVMTELDLLLTLNQYKQMYTTGKRTKRKALRDKTALWENCVVFYEITDTIRQADVRIIGEAIGEWEKYTCLRFIKSATSPRRIQFKDGMACYSRLGMQATPQPIILGSACMIPGVVVHEIGHAIGWIHEHMRPDRDEHIRVNFENIQNSSWHQFRKYNESSINTFGVPYDYLSIMHYGSDSYPGSMTTLDPEYQHRIGQRHGFSFKDIKLANVMYSCAVFMGCVQRECPRDGFLFYREFKGRPRCQCWCDSSDVHDPLIPCDTVDGSPVTPSPRPALPPEKLIPCQDIREDCRSMKAAGQCMTHLEMMMDKCAATCEFCGKGKGVCMDYQVGCATMAAGGLCEDIVFKWFMQLNCRASCGLCPGAVDQCSIHQELLGTGRQG
ncbi:unnamed protein product [Lymnaea stagnalis]|uniref:Metalloendopeptidase n=1 Tax=Lymnaea stagnalis TaxID=6523 RepID=A0AAV2I5Y8_LYMST